VEVVNLRFAEVPANVIPEPTGWLSSLTVTKDDVMHWIELGVMLLLALVVLLLVVRPLIRRILETEPPPPAKDTNIAAAIAGGDVQAGGDRGRRDCARNQGCCCGRPRPRR